MDTILQIKMWDKEVAATYWDINRDCAVLEFYESFTKENSGSI